MFCNFQSSGFHILIISFFLVASLADGVTPVDQRYGQAPATCEINSKTDVTLSAALAAKSANNVAGPLGVTCVQRVIVEAGENYNVPSGIVVNGELYFEDKGAGTSTTLTTPFILVQGKVVAGTIASPYKGDLRITLTDATVDAQLSVRTDNKALFGNTINLGRKAFAAYGGHVSLVGYIPDNYITYAKLANTAAKGATVFYVQGNMTPFWKPNDKLGIARSGISTQANADSACTIKSVTYDTQLLSTKVEVEEPLQNEHEVRIVKINRSPPKYYFLSSEVTKLNRNIVISGLQPTEDVDNWLDTGNVQALGGHFMIAHAAGPQIVHGVEFVGMGQAGILGRYPLHMHFGGNVHTDSKFSFNSIHRSKQRCLVVHATNNLMVSHNVAFRTHGHCYMTEDGVEINNFFIGNLGISTRAAIALIDRQSTDNRASTFWMAAPNNHLILNAAGGAHGGGYWIEPTLHVRGPSKTFQVPGHDSSPIKSKMGHFAHNSAHSSEVGLMTYPGGVFVPGETPALLKNILVWSCFRGWLTLAGQNQHLSDSAFLDVWMQGIHTRHVAGHRAERVDISLSEKNHIFCADDQVHAIHFENHITNFKWREGITGLQFDDIFIQNFNTGTGCTKSPAALRFINDKTDQWFPPSSLFKNFGYSNVGEKVRITFEAATHKQLAFRQTNIGLPGINAAVDGYLVSVDQPVLMAKANCQYRSGLNFKLRFCPNSCWRMVAFAYMETATMGNTKILVLPKSGGAFYETPDKRLRHAHGINVNAYMFRSLPEGEYTIAVYDAFNKLLSITKENVRFYRPDEHYGGVPSCTGQVSLYLFGDTTPLQTPELSGDDMRHL